MKGPGHQSSWRNNKTSSKPSNQTLNSIKMNLATKDTRGEVKNSNSSTTAPAVTSNLVNLVLSGTMLASTHALAMQALETSSLARSFKIRVTPTERSITQLQASPLGPAKQEVEPFARGTDTDATTEAYKLAPSFRSRGDSIPDSDVLERHLHSQSSSLGKTSLTFQETKGTVNQDLSCHESFSQKEIVEQSERRRVRH